MDQDGHRSEHVGALDADHIRWAEIVAQYVQRSTQKVHTPKSVFRFTEFSEVACPSAPVGAAALWPLPYAS